MKTISILFLSLLFIGFFNSCNEPSEGELIRTFYLKHKPKGDFNDFRKVVLINELGGCLNCTNMFATEMEDSIYRKDILFIVSGSGAKIDISSYIDITLNNVIWDSLSKFDDFDIFNTSGILYIDSNLNVIKKEENRVAKLPVWPFNME